MYISYSQVIVQILGVHNGALTTLVETWSVKQTFNTMKQDHTYVQFGLLHSNTNEPLDGALLGAQGALGSYEPTEQT